MQIVQAFITTLMVILTVIWYSIAPSLVWADDSAKKLDQHEAIQIEENKENSPFIIITPEEKDNINYNKISYAIDYALKSLPRSSFEIVVHSDKNKDSSANIFNVADKIGAIITSKNHQFDVKTLKNSYGFEEKILVYIKLENNKIQKSD